MLKCWFVVCGIVVKVLESAGLSTTYIYSSLDQTARKINAAKFVSKKTNILLVTDVAVSAMPVALVT